MSELESAKYWLSWVERGNTVALFMVAFGVGYEFLADRLAAPLRRKIEQANEREIAELRTRAAEANLEIQRIKTPRRLSPEQQQQLGLELKAAGGQRFSLAVGQDPEQLNLLADIRATLQSSGWQVVPAVGLGDIAIGDAALSFGTGVIVRLAPHADGKTGDAAHLLVKGLNEAGIASKTEEDPRLKDPSVMNVFVGTKPMR